MRERLIETADLGTGERLMLLADAQARLYVGEELVWSVSAMGDGIVALSTSRRTVHIGAADYWRLLYGELPPSMRVAGYMAAQLAHARSHAAELIDQLAREGLLDHARYPAISAAATALDTALGLPMEPAAL